MEPTPEPDDAAVQRLNHTRLQPAIPGSYNLTQEDSNWMVTSAFIIFTMQTGESGGAGCGSCLTLLRAMNQRELQVEIQMKG